MHHDRVGRSAFEMWRLQAVVNRVLAHRGKERRVLALALDTQNHHDVRTFNRVLEMFLDAQTSFDEFGEVVRHERAWTTDTHVRAELREQVDIRPRDARMQDVADDRDFQSFNATLVLANRRSEEHT